MSVAHAAVLSIGTELTRGEIVNTNASWLADALSALGLEVGRAESVADDPADIERALERLSSEYRIVISTGGLGPTTDDLTSATVAAWLGVPLETHAPSLAALEARLTRLGRQLTPSNAKQVDFPRGASVLENPNGTAPGFSLGRGRCQLFFMPGVPREMRPMFERYVPDAARALADGAPFQVRLRCFGLPESTINDRLDGLAAAYPVRVAYRAHFPEIEVKLFARVPAAPSVGIEQARSEAERIARAAAREARLRLGPVVYSEGDQDLPAVIAESLRQAKLTLSVAESCTGGLVGALLTAQPTSDVFMGGVIAYANAIKTELLGVEPALLERHGAVSEQVAQAMAQGARERCRTDLGLSLTGIAGPTGGTADKPVGLVHFAVASARGVTARQIVVNNRPRRDVQLYSAWAALALVREEIAALAARSAG
jgi:competence/damage-inducible protein CinA-like protein